MSEKPTYEELEQIVDELKKAVFEDKWIHRDLKISLSHLRTTLDSTADGILAVDTEGNVVLFSKQFAKMWKIPESVMESKEVDKALAFVLDQLLDPQGFLSKVNELYADPESESFDILEFKDGRIFERYSVPHFLKGEILGRVWSFRDITKRMQAEEALRKSEEKYRNIYENAVEGFFQSTPEGRFISVNPAFSKMLGYDNPEDLVSSISDIAAQYYASTEDRKLYKKILKKNGKVENFEFKAKRKDGSEIWVSNSTRAYFDAEGMVVRYEGIVLDITARKQAEHQREILIFDLQEALNEVKLLSGLIPICTHCKKIRDDKGYWNRIEAYIQDHSEAKFSHSICQECAKKHYPGMDIYDG